MSPEQILEELEKLPCCSDEYIVKEIVTKQAELSYKAGMKAVADYLKPKGIVGHRFDGGTWIEFAVDFPEWQAFLKENGLLSHSKDCGCKECEFLGRWD